MAQTGDNTLLNTLVRCTLASGNLERVKELLDEGGHDVDVADAEGNTAMIFACEGGRTQAARLLLERGANPNLHNTTTGRTPLHVACFGGHCGCVILLLASPKLHPLDELDAEQRSALYIACWQGHTQCARLLINRRADLELKTAKGLWPLYIAANRGHSDCVQALLAANAEPDAQTNNAATPLGTACEHGRAACAAQLIAAGAAVEHTSKFGTTALHWACKRGQVECASLLLEAHANPSATNKEGSTPLALAADVRHEAALNRLLPRADAARSPGFPTFAAYLLPMVNSPTHSLPHSHPASLSASPLLSCRWDSWPPSSCCSRALASASTQRIRPARRRCTVPRPRDTQPSQSTFSHTARRRTWRHAPHRASGRST